MHENLKKDFQEYCKKIDIKYLSDAYLNKSTLGCEYPMSIEIKDPVFEGREEILFVMFSLFTKGYYYYNTLNLVDSIIYEDDSLVMLYKECCSVIYYYCNFISNESSLYFIPYGTKHTVNKETTHILSLIQYCIYKLISTQDHNIIEEMINLVNKALEIKWSPVTKGYSYGNLLHFYSHVIITKLKLPLISDLLLEIKNDLLIAKEILETNELFYYFLRNAEKIINLNIIFKIFFYKYFYKMHYKYFFCDFKILRSNLNLGNTNKSQEYEKILFFYKILQIKNMVDKEEFLKFLKYFKEDNKDKEPPVTKCNWTNEMYSIYKCKK